MAILPDDARRTSLARLVREGVDVLVVGGGITGAGVARDASLRGLRVALIDKGDWAAGTSSRSSKLVHGGLRYLESLELGLVLESTRERRRQRRLNPHVVWPVPFVLPVYEGAKHGLTKLDLGLWLYDLLAMFRAFKLHRRQRPATTSAQIPGLLTQGLRGSVRYYDCRTNDARLVLANVRALRRQGGVALNYVRFEGPRFAGSRVASGRLRDVHTGGTYEISCKHIVYAAGHWTDRLAEAPGGGALIRPTKGVHLVVARERLPLDAAVALSSITDGRAMFAVPFENTTYLGTTDTDYDGDLDEVHATREDVDYILDTINHYFPDAALTDEDVRATWAGLRPLLREPGKSAYRTSREHQIFSDRRGLTTIAGGKLTTYRAMAAEVVGVVAKALQREHGLRIARCRTHKVPLDPDLTTPPAAAAGPTAPGEEALWRLHGSDAGWIRRRMRDRAAEGEAICAELPYVLAQVSWAVLGEQARTLQDVLVRRLPIFYLAADQGLGAAAGVADLMAALLGRDQTWVAAQIREYGRLIDANQAWRHGSPTRLAQSP